MTVRPRHLPLTALRTFEVAARRLSFKDAADELCVSATTVSNQIRQLEADWNCKLFIRKTRAVMLTDEGRSLSQVLTKAFDDIRAEVAVRKNTERKSGRKSVTLAVGPIFGARWLVPRLEQFRLDHPQIDLVLGESPRITDGADMTSDLAVDWGAGLWLGLSCDKLFDVRYAPVLRAECAAKHGGIERPEDLLRVPLIHQRDSSEWAAWFKLAALRAEDYSDGITIRDSNLVLQAALAGHGVALGVFPFVQSDVDRGDLIKPFEIELVPKRSFYLLSRPVPQQKQEVIAVQNWLLRQAEGYRAESGSSLMKVPSRVTQ